MSNEFLGDRKKALEDSFFAKESEKLRRELGGKGVMLAKRDALSEDLLLTDKRLRCATDGND